MKFLVTIGLDYLRRYLLPRFGFSAALYSFVELIFKLGEKTLDIHTDNNPDNKEQMRSLFEEHCVEMASTFTASLVSLLKSNTIKQKIAAILEDAAMRLKASTAAPEPLLRDKAPTA